MIHQKRKQNGSSISILFIPTSSSLLGFGKKLKNGSSGLKVGQPFIQGGEEDVIIAATIQTRQTKIFHPIFRDSATWIDDIDDRCSIHAFLSLMVSR